MKFNEQLGRYMNTYGFSARSLSESSGLSEASISRYRSGARIPSRDSEELESLLKGIRALTPEGDHQQIEDTLISMLPYKPNDPIDYVHKLQQLISTLGISQSQLSRHIGYDPSYLSRIISGDRTPTDYISLSESIVTYIIDFYSPNTLDPMISELTGVSAEHLQNPGEVRHFILSWLLDDESIASNTEAEDSSMADFLQKLDDFDLNEYMARIKFDRIKVPTSPIKSTSTKHYHGVEGMKKAEIEFLKRTVLSSKSTEIYEYSSLPMDEPASDEAFSKKWMIGLAMTLKKGIKINIIHDLNRPFHEMVLGLESWIPLYMTGLINSFYLDQYDSDGYSHLCRSSEACNLVGECIGHDLKTAHFTLTSDPTLISSMKKYTESTFRNAKPLAEVYTADKLSLYENVRKKEAALATPRTISGRDTKLYQNITLELFGDNCVAIIKEKSPKTVFVFRHPKFIAAVNRLYS